MERNGKSSMFKTVSLLALCMVLFTSMITGCGKKEKDNPPLTDQPIPENAVITSTPLDQITPYNGGFTWNSGDAADYDGNDFTDCSNYTILHAAILSGWSNKVACGETKVYSAEYKLDKKYQTLSFQMSPYTDVTEGSGSSYVRVFSNGVLRYTSFGVAQKSGVMKIENIDISDADFLRIEVTVAGKRCMMLSDVIVNTVSPYNSKLDPKKVSLNTLKVFNGGFDFNSGYPQDIFGNSYNDTMNYAFLHAGVLRGWSDRIDCGEAKSYSAEYHVEKKYRTLTLDVAPSSHFAQNASTSIKVFVDDELKYTSPVINQKTEKFNIGEIDISEAEYIKIVADVGAHGCIILSDMILTTK